MNGCLLPTPEEILDINKKLKGRRIVGIRSVTMYGIELRLDDGSILHYWNQSSDYENWGVEIT